MFCSPILKVRGRSIQMCEHEIFAYCPAVLLWQLRVLHSLKCKPRTPLIVEKKNWSADPSPHVALAPLNAPATYFQFAKKSNHAWILPHSREKGEKFASGIFLTVNTWRRTNILFHKRFCWSLIPRGSETRLLDKIFDPKTGFESSRFFFLWRTAV